MKFKVLFIFVFLVSNAARASEQEEHKSQAQRVFLNTQMTSYAQSLLKENELTNYWNPTYVKLKKIQSIKTCSDHSFDHYEPQMRIPYDTYLKIKSTDKRPLRLFGFFLTSGTAMGLWGGGMLGLLLDGHSDLALTLASFGACLGALSGGTIGIIIEGIATLSGYYSRDNTIVALNTNWRGKPATHNNTVEVRLVGISDQLRKFSTMLDQPAFIARYAQSYQTSNEQPTNYVSQEDFEVID